MAGSLLVLLDDIATILDDVGAMTKVAATKTSGVVGDDLAVNSIYLLVEQLQMICQPLNQLPKRQRKLVAGILEQGWHSLVYKPNPLGNDQAHLTQQPPDLVGLRCACFDETLPDPVQRSPRNVRHRVTNHIHRCSDRPEKWL